MSVIVEPERKTPVVSDVDVVVVGGGTAGVVAAIASARNGAETLLIERLACLGGGFTKGLVTHFSHLFDYPDIRYTGIPFEFLNRLVKLGATDKETMEKWPNLDVGYAAWFDPEMASYVFLLMAEEAGVKLMLNTYFCDAIVEENAVKGVIVQNKSGRQAVRAKVVVDATGEADVAASAGVPCTLNKGLPFGLITRIGNVNHEKVVQYLSENPVTEPDSEFKEWFKEYLVKQLGLPPEDAVKTGCYKVWTYSYPDRPIKKIWEEKGSWNFCPMEIWKLAQKAVKNGDLDIIRKVDGVGTVEAGWDGLYYQSGAEKCVHGNICMLWGPDGSNGEHVTKVEVAARKYTVELVNFLKKYFPGFEGAQIMDVGVRTMPRTSREIEGEYHFKREDRKSARFPDAVYTWVSLAREELSDIPFRILLPKNIDNLLAAGKCASGGGLIRNNLSCMCMGQAAGTAAAIAAKKGVSPKALDIKELQKTLKEQGMVIRD